MDGISQGLIANIITSGVENFFSPKINSISRRKVINQKKYGQEYMYEIISSEALDDVHIILGSLKDQWCEKHQDFLNELQRTEIPSAIVAQSFEDSKDNGVKQRFIYLFKCYIDDEEKADNFYNILNSSINLIINEKFINDYLGTKLKYIRRDIQEINQRILEQTSITKGVEVSLKQRKEFREKYCSKLLSTVKYLSVETDQGQKRIDISRLFVSPEITIHSDRGHTDAILSAGRYSHNDGFKYASLKNKIKKCVIVGDPGGGKTTICQYICYDYSKRILNSIKFPDKEIEYKNQKLPVEIVLRTLAKNKNFRDEGLFSHLSKEINKTIGVFDDSNAVISNFMSDGLFVVIFDGLDEIISVSDRRAMVSEIEKFANAFPLTKIIITSRIVGYEDAPLNDDFDIFRIERLDESGVLEYVKKFMVAVARKKVVDAKIDAEMFVKQTQQNAFDLRQNPLMLGLMSWIFWQKKSIPQNRPQIYEECATLMFEKWDSRRDINAVDYTDFGLIELFSFLAYEIFGEIKKEDGVSKKWVNDKCYEYFLEWYESKPKAKERSTEISDFICGRAWLMSRFGPDSYRFSHRTFLEYFFANELVSRNEKVSSLILLILKNIQKSNWSVVAHLSLQQKTWRKNHYVQEAFDSLSNSLKIGKPTRQKKAKIKFCAESTEYLRGPEKVYREFCSNIIKESLFCKDTGLLYDVLRSLVKNSRDRDYIIVEEINKITTELIDANNYFAVNNIISIVGSKYFTIFFDGGKKNRVGFYSSGDNGLSISMEIFKSRIWKKATESSEWGIIYLSEFSENIDNLYDIHGPSLFSQKSYLDDAVGVSSVLDRVVLGRWQANQMETSTLFPIKIQSIDFDVFDRFSIIFDRIKSDLYKINEIENLQTTLMPNFVWSLLSAESLTLKGDDKGKHFQDLKTAVILAMIAERNPKNNHMWSGRGGVTNMVKKSLINKKGSNIASVIAKDIEFEREISILGLLNS